MKPEQSEAERSWRRRQRRERLLDAAAQAILVAATLLCVGLALAAFLDAVAR